MTSGVSISEKSVALQVFLPAVSCANLLGHRMLRSRRAEEEAGRLEKTLPNSSKSMVFLFLKTIFITKTWIRTLVKITSRKAFIEIITT